jgi:hypothetical protein
MSYDDAQLKQDLFDFIKSREPHLVSIVDIQVKNVYVLSVHCKVKCPDTSVPINNWLMECDRMAEVNEKLFHEWLELRDAVKWL